MCLILKKTLKNSFEIVVATVVLVWLMFCVVHEIFGKSTLGHSFTKPSWVDKVFGCYVVGIASRKGTSWEEAQMKGVFKFLYILTPISESIDSSSTSVQEKNND